MLTACGSTTEHANCVDDWGNVVDDSNCDSGSATGSYFIFMDSTQHRPGERLTLNEKQRKSLVRYNDTAARDKLGLKPGKVSGQTVSKSRFGGFGGGSHSSGSGGS